MPLRNRAVCGLCSITLPAAGAAASAGAGVMPVRLPAAGNQRPAQHRSTLWPHAPYGCKRIVADLGNQGSRDLLLLKQQASRHKLLL